MTGAPSDTSTQNDGRNPIRVGLSARVFVLAISFVMIAELLIFIPSVAQFRVSWLEDRLASAQIAALALLASEDNMVSDTLREELLLNAQVKGVVLQRSDQKHLILSDDMPPMSGAFFDLDHQSFLQTVTDAFGALIRQQPRYIRVRGMALNEPGGYVEILIDEEPLCAAMFDYGRNIFLLSLLIAFIAGGLLYLALAGLLISPLQRLIQAMTGFRAQPQSDRYLVSPSARHDEIGDAESALAHMQTDIQNYLKMQARQAALGRAVQKINHDLRNIFATVHLLSDRLGESNDPAVQRVAPRFVNAIDRALSMSQHVLQYGSAEEAAPKVQNVNLRHLVDEARLATLAEDQDSTAIQFDNQIDEDLSVFADPDQLFRILMNVSRNAVQAFGQVKHPGQIIVAARRRDNVIEIDVSDNAGGVPKSLQPTLFEPFATSSHTDGTGLGLAIARELAQGHGGSIALHASGPDGSCFRVTLPDRNDAGDM